MNVITEIRKSSSMLHATSENTGFIKRIVDGEASIDGYAEYLFNLSAMYKCIEDMLEKNNSNEIIKNFATPELYRYDLIQQDLEYLIGDKVNSMELLASTTAYISRIKELQETNPELIIAHAYTRFLADLFGGRTFAELFSSKYKIDSKGLNYYNCDKIKDVRSFAMQYASKFNDLDLSDDLKTKLINEVNNNYIYNLAISTELETKLNK